MGSGLVSMKEIQNRRKSKSTSAPVVSPSADSPKNKSGLVSMADIKAKRAEAKPVEVSKFKPISADPSQSEMMQFINKQPSKSYDASIFEPAVLHPESSPVMQQANKYNTEHPDSAWQSIFDNPITHGAGVGLQWAMKPFETVSTVLADTSGAVNNLFGSNQRMGYDGKNFISTPSESRNVFNDIKNIWSQTTEHVSRDAWAGDSPNYGKIKGTSANWTDAIDMGFQSLSPSRFITGPIKLASEAANIGKGDVAFQKAIDEFILRTKQAPVNADGVSTSFGQAGKQGLVKELPAAPGKSEAADAITATFNRVEKYREQHKQAIEDQYNYLKQSMEQRGGVEQGNVIKDPTTGEVIDRYGRVSNNPRWYQDFFKENGKKPTDADLRKLAEQHVKSGFDDEMGRIPAWKPADLHDLDEEIKNIHELLPHADEATKLDLRRALVELEQSRVETHKAVPKEVKTDLVPMSEIKAKREQGHVEAAAAVPEVVKEPTDLDELIKFKGHSASTPETIAQVYNEKTWYHGSGTDKLTAEMLDPNVGNHESLFGHGIYLTDNPDIAAGYAKSRGKRTGTPTINDLNVKVNKVLDLEKPITPDVAETIQATFGPSLDYLSHARGYDKGYFSNIISTELAKEGTTPESLIRKIKEEIADFSHDEQISTEEFVENFQELATNLKEAGYDALTHTGGLRTGKDPHRVMIMLDPQNWHGSTAGEGSQVTRMGKYVKPEEVAPAAEVAASTSPDLIPMSEIKANRAKGEVKAKAPKQPRTLETATAQDDVKNYAGNHMPFRQATNQAERTINRNKVIGNIRKNLDVIIDSGRLGKGMKNVLGIYKTTPEVIRSGMAEDIQTIAHEVGHHLDKKFKLQDPQYRAELDALMKFSGHNTGAYTQAQQLEEGIAEYVRLYLTDRTNAYKYAPNFTDHFEKLLSPKALKGLEATTADIDTWITQGDYEQAKGLIDFDGAAEKAPLNKDKLYTRFIDDLNPIQLAEKALKGAIGIGKDSMYKMARLSRGVAERAKLSVTRGIYDAAGNKISDGLRDIVKPLEELGIKESDFSLYLAVKHAIDLKALGKRIPFNDAQISAVMNRMDIPEVQAVQKKIIEFNNALTDILVDAQILDPMTVAAMRKQYPNYTPYMRYFAEDVEAGFKSGGFGAAKGFANITNPIKRMSEEGSYRTIINPIESMVKNAFLVMNAAAKNKVGLQLADLSKVDGAGAWVEHVPGGSSSHEHVVNVFVNGERQAYKIRDPELYNAMLSLDAESSNSLIKFLGGTAGLLRAGATLTPEFMIRNAMRDVVGAMVNSTKYGFTPVDFFKGMYHVLGKTETMDQFLSSGGAMGTLMSLDRDVTREALQKVFRKSIRDKTMNVITSPKEIAKMITLYTPVKFTVGMLRKGAEISELSTKVGVFNKVLKKTGSMEEAAYTAKDLMDFNRAGSSIRQANRAVAFLNAGLQGSDRMVRSFKDNPAGFLTRAFTTLVLPAVAIHYWNESLPKDLKATYDNIPQWQKDTFFIFNIPGTDQFARIPKPFEAGMLFATGTERLLNWTKDHDKEAWNDYGTSVLQSLTPPTLFTALAPLLEAITNYSFFRKAPIVPMGEQDIERVDQFGPYTSEVAKNLGKAATAVGLGDKAAASPRIIDNTLKGYTAGLGQYAIDGIDKAIDFAGGGDDTPLPAKHWSEQPVIRSFIATTSGGGQIRQDFYDKWADLTRAKGSAARHNEKYSDPMYGAMQAAKTFIDAQLKQYKVIQKDKNMNSKEKRVQLDKLDGIINSAAAQALGKGGIK